jgi:hypothetical protein
MNLYMITKDTNMLDDNVNKYVIFKWALIFSLKMSWKLGTGDSNLQS